MSHQMPKKRALSSSFCVLFGSFLLFCVMRQNNNQDETGKKQRLSSSSESKIEEEEEEEALCKIIKERESCRPFFFVSLSLLP
jgi:hypothetical protein